MDVGRARRLSNSSVTASKGDDWSYFAITTNFMKFVRLGRSKRCWNKVFGCSWMDIH